MALVAALEPLGFDRMWIKNHVTDAGTMLAVVDAGLLGNLVDVPKFAKGSIKIKESAWMLVDYGEKPGGAFAVRAAIETAMPLPDGAEPVARATKEEFAAWNLWQVNKSALWLPTSKLMTHCTRLKVDPKEVFKFVRRSKADARLCLYHRLHEDLLDIERMLAAAIPLPSSVRPSIALDDVQNAAVKTMCESAVSYLQGGAGVGKTTTTSHMIASIHSHVACLAFTHKAKRCLAAKIQAAGLGAKVEVATIHAFINKYKAPDAYASPTAIIVDECSMVDVELLAALARVLLLKFAVGGFSLKFIGDKAQLPPIGRGEFFKDRVNAGLHVVELKKCYRTDKPDLFDAYQSIREGTLPPSTPNFSVLMCEDDREINSKVGALVSLHGASMQFIAWQNKDVWKINKWVQERRIAKGEVGPERFRGFMKGDLIVYVGENSEVLTNAMTGEVKSCSNSAMSVEWEDGSTTTVASEGAVQLRYCITVHKSQGSEYKDVVVPCFDVAKMAKCVDCRRWLYTAVTRGQSSVTMLCAKNIQSAL